MWSTILSWKVWTISPWNSEISLLGCMTTEGTECSIIWAWAPGMSPLVTPPQAGFRAGPRWVWMDFQQFTSFLVPMHLNLCGCKLTSIMLVWFPIWPIVLASEFTTLKIWGIMMQVSLIREMQWSPIHMEFLLEQLGHLKHRSDVMQGTVEVEYECPAECTMLMEHSIHIFSSFLHMHEVGLHIWATHWRNGQMIGEINRIDFWDFAYQQVCFFSKSSQIHPEYSCWYCFPTWR